MTDSQSREARLVWNDEYSVNVREIDDQHKRLFEIINTLIQSLNSVPKEEAVRESIRNIIEFKMAHFATEEKYFHQFNYEETAAHEEAHREFDQKIQKLEETYKDDAIAHAFELADFLEDWFLGHTLHMDHKYIKCFNEQGLS